MSFLAAGLVQLVESDLSQYSYHCKYINENTDWEPSCSPEAPADNSCDCIDHNCFAWYQPGDNKHEPSLIRCIGITFFDAFYFIIVTTATVGYGDISPSNSLSRIVVMLYILVSIVVIPVQLNKIQNLISMRSVYRKPLELKAQENHVILCGYVNDKDKLSLFFKEFFHPDRVFSSAPEFHAVILCPQEPDEDVRVLISSAILDSRVTYIIGSALSVEDLKNVRADVASGMFFLCNTEIGYNASNLEDAATVMRALSVSNFNAELDCLVQVIRPEDRTILKDSDIDVILCLEEFKTALQARNSICPGFSTFIENLFHSFGAVSETVESSLDPWYSEYLHGARMELYYVPLDPEFLRVMGYNYDRIRESFFLEFEVIMLGLCSENQDDIVFNPTMKDLGDHKTFKAYFKLFNVALIMADDQMQAESITRGLTDIHIVESMLLKLQQEELSFPCQVSQNIAQSAPEETMGIVQQSVKSNFKLQALNTIRNNLKFGGGNELALNVLKREVKDVVEQLSDSDSEDGETYFGYVQKKEVIAVNSRARKMSSDLGGGIQVSTVKKKGPAALLASRRPYVNSPVVELDTSRKIFRNSLTKKRPSEVTVQEEEENNEEDEDEEEDDDQVPKRSFLLKPSAETNSLPPKPLLSRLSQVGTMSKITIISPTSLLSSPQPDKTDGGKKKMPPRPLMKAATISSGLGQSKGIRQTLKELHDKSPISSPNSSPVTNGKHFEIEGKEKPAQKKIFHRPSSATVVPAPQHIVDESPIPSRSRSDSDHDIPGPPSEPPPFEDSPIFNRKRLNSEESLPASKESDPPREPEPEVFRPSLISKTSSLERNDSLFGKPSKVIENVTFKDHVIVSGNDSYIAMFISELRRPSMKGSAYHPILIVSPNIPSKWEAIQGRYNDVYVILGSMTRSVVFNRLNINDAFAVILLASGESVAAAAQEENIDSSILFAYLKLEQYIPREVFFSVELTCSANVAVLNATIMRRARRNPAEYFRTSHARIAKAKTTNPATVLTPEVTAKKSYQSLANAEAESKNSSTPKSSNEGDANERQAMMRQTIYQPVSTVSISRHNSQRTSKHATNKQQMATTPQLPSSPVGSASGSNSFELVIQVRDVESNKELDSNDGFWDATDTHHMLPIFASARAYVPSSFESLLVQSFFNVLTPLICEKLVCGQSGQVVLQIDVPPELIGKRFLDIFRLMSSNHVVCFGLYRAPSIQQKAILPYVFISPPPSTILGRHDHIFVYGKQTRITRALQSLKTILEKQKGFVPPSPDNMNPQAPGDFPSSPSKGSTTIKISPNI